MKLRNAVRMQDEECILSIVSCLFFNLKDISYARVVNKFLKHDFEKVHRCLELHGAYYFRCHDGDEESNDSRYSDEDKLSDKLEKGLSASKRWILYWLYYTAKM